MEVALLSWLKVKLAFRGDTASYGSLQLEDCEASTMISFVLGGELCTTSGINDVAPYLELFFFIGELHNTGFQIEKCLYWNLYAIVLVLNCEFLV